MKIDDSMLQGLFQYCFALTTQREAALDLVQDAVERAIRQPALLKNPIAYLKTIARHRFYDLQKLQGRQRLEALEALDEVADEESLLENIISDQRILSEIWLELSVGEREVVFLWAVDGLSAAQIARELEIPRGTVLSRLHRLRTKLSAKNPSLDHHSDESRSVSYE